MQIYLPYSKIFITFLCFVVFEKFLSFFLLNSLALKEPARIIHFFFQSRFAIYIFIETKMFFLRLYLLADV